MVLFRKAFYSSGFIAPNCFLNLSNSSVLFQLKQRWLTHCCVLMIQIWIKDGDLCNLLLFTISLLCHCFSLYLLIQLEMTASFLLLLKLPSCKLYLALWCKYNYIHTTIQKFGVTWKCLCFYEEKLFFLSIKITWNGSEIQ